MIAPPPPPIILTFRDELIEFITRLGSAAYNVYRERGTLRVQLTSWWRSREHNALVGGDARSQHLYGLALDIVGDDAGQLGRAWVALGGVTVPESDHFHLQLYSAADARRLLPELVI